MAANNHDRKYGDDGISLSEARDKVIEFRKMIASGENPADAQKIRLDDPTSIVDVAEMYIKSNRYVKIP
ncbi:DUF4102 domain-containing protein [Gallibacterium anatis]|uniref:DUF4102 domain-containing protein n=1 Tax=Gallibacterium anatis TaxID=750 RepID=A0A930UVW0_9PAST|nr:DUF4102 domain-containing protein [Gallibacterium anatis]